MYPDPTLARRTGALTLIMAGLAFFGMLYVPSALIVPGDAAATAGKILASEGLFRLGIVTDALVCLIEIALTAMLYVLLKPAGKTLALAGLCYVVQSFGTLLFPAYAATFAIVGGLSMIEIAFPLWLVFKGVRVRLPAAGAFPAAQPER